MRFRNNFGCGGRTRTYDLRVMSPTSFQLLYSAIFGCAPQCLYILAPEGRFVKHFFQKQKNILSEAILVGEQGNGRFQFGGIVVYWGQNIL